MAKQNRNTRLFLGFLLLAGLANMTGRMLPASLHCLISCLHNVIFTGLLIFWLESLRIRLLPSRRRTYMYAAACFMLLYLFLRMFAYLFALTAAARRYTVYAYWIPQTMIPALFFMTCIRIRREKRIGGGGNELLLLIPAGALSLMALTNDLHFLVYVPWIPLSEFRVATGTYGYHAGFMLLNAWMVLAVASGLILLFREAGRLSRKAVLLFAGDMFLWYGLLLANRLQLYARSGIWLFNVPETNIFGMLGIFEIAIRGHLIPCNENYAGFFGSLQMPVLITDRKLRPVYASASEISAGEEALLASLTAPVYPEANQKLSGKEIRGGYAFWVENETDVRRAQNRLVEANEMIEQENTLMEAEAKQKEENAHLAARHRIYQEIAGEMYPVQKRIGALLSEAVPGTEGCRDRIAEAAVLNAYVKRKTNLLLLASEKEQLSACELYLAMEESAGYLAYRGLQVSVGAYLEEFLPAKELIRLYDTFQQIAEQLTGKASSLMVSFHEGGLRLAAETDLRPDVRDCALPVSFLESDGILYMDLSAGEGGASP